jgi:hypothetical protein
MHFHHKSHVYKPFADLIPQALHYSKASMINMANNQSSGYELKGAEDAR